MRILAAVVVLFLCAGCAGKIPAYGNPAGADSAELVHDAVFVMFETYPPAHVRLALVREADDAFGARLVESLRLHGYAVAAYAGPEKKGRSGNAARRPDGLPFAYLVDGAGSDNVLRVVIHVGSESLSRLYLVEGEGTEVRYVPLGFWSRRVDGSERQEIL